MDLQEKLFEECCAMIAHAHKAGKDFPSHINVMAEISFANKRLSDLQKLHEELQKFIAPALLENVVEQKPFFSLWLTRFSLGVFAIGLVVFSICSVLYSFTPTKTMQHGSLLGAVFAANGFYLLYELKRIVANFAVQQSVKMNMWMRCAIGIFASVFLVEAVIAETQIMQTPRFVPLLFVFSFPFAIFHSWDIACMSMKKLFCARDTSEDIAALLAKEIVVLHRYPANSPEAHAQCANIQNFLQRHNLLDDIDLLAQYAADDTHEYLKLLLFTRFIATHENIVAEEHMEPTEHVEPTVCIDEIVDTHIQKTLHNLRKNSTKKSKKVKKTKKTSKKNTVKNNSATVNEIFEQEFVSIRDNDNAKSDNV